MATSSLPPPLFNPNHNYSCHHVSSDSSVSELTFSIQAAESNCHQTTLEGFPPNYWLRPNWNLGESPSSCPSITCIIHTIIWVFSPTLPPCSQQPDLRASLEGHSWLGCCSDTSLFCAFYLDACIYGFRHSSRYSLFPSSTFMDSAFLFFLLLSPVSGQRDGCCVMSVIVLILLFSQRFNSFMLLPNFYWLIICILCMITFPLPGLCQLWGLHFHAGWCSTWYFDSTL